MGYGLCVKYLKKHSKMNFIACVVFMEAVFSKINLVPDEGILAYNMHEIIMRTGHEMTDLVIECTDFKLLQSSN